MDFLDPRRSLMRYTNMHVGFAQGPGYLSTAMARQGHHRHFTLVGGFYGRQHIGRVAAGAQRQQHIASASQGAHLFGKNHTEVVVVGDRRENGTVGRQGEGSEFGPLAFIAANKLGRKMLGIGCRTAVAAGQYFAAAGDAGQNRLHGGGNGFGQNLRGLVFQVGTVDEVLFDTLF